MSKGWEIYQGLLADLRSECDEMVQNGECTQEWADFRYSMKKDEILMDMPDELFDEKCGAKMEIHYPGLVVGSEREKKLKRFLEENELPSLLAGGEEVLIVDPEEEQV